MGGYNTQIRTLITLLVVYVTLEDCSIYYVNLLQWNTETPVVTL